MRIEYKQRLARELERLEEEGRIIMSLRDGLEGLKGPRMIWLKQRYSYLLGDMEREKQKLRDEIEMKKLAERMALLLRGKEEEDGDRGDEAEGAGAMPDPAGRAAEADEQKPERAGASAWGGGLVGAEHGEREADPGDDPGDYGRGQRKAGDRGREPGRLNAWQYKVMEEDRRRAMGNEE